MRLLSLSYLIELVEAVTLNLIRDRDFSADEEFACPYIENTSKISEAPMLEPVPLVVRFSSKAFVIVLSDFAQYLLTPII
jgi:hypothetical protein